MSVSTDAILFYGFCIPEGEPPWYDEEKEEGDWYDWEEVYLAKKGVKREKKKTDKAYWEACSKQWDKEACNIGTHCSDECPEYYVYVKASEICASRGYPEKVSKKHLQRATEKWNAKLDAFCKTLGIKPRKYGWYLVSYWG